MKITFACPQCAKPLVADSALAGRTGRCRHCGHRAVVPGGPPAAGGPRQVPSGTDAAQGQRPAARPAAADWRAAVAGQLPATTPRAPAATDDAAGRPATDTTGSYSLRPVTPVNEPTLPASDWDHAELGPAVAVPPTVFTVPATVGPKRSQAARSSPATAAAPGAAPRTAAAGASSAKQGRAKPNAAGIVERLMQAVTPLANMVAPGAAWPAQNGASPIIVAYRLFFGLLGRLTAWISETSYTVSFILIILAVASGMIGRHSLAAMACWAIVALNLVGLAGDFASLVTLSFRKNPLQGGLFLVPPFTLYYLWTDWQRYRDTVVRMRIPLMTLALVAAAYVFVPWLRGGSKQESRIVESVTRAVDAVEKGLAGREGVLDEGLKKAQSWLREVPLPDPSTLPGSSGTHQPEHHGKP